GALDELADQVGLVGVEPGIQDPRGAERCDPARSPGLSTEPVPGRGVRRRGAAQQGNRDGGAVGQPGQEGARGIRVSWLTSDVAGQPVPPDAPRIIGPQRCHVGHAAAPLVLLSWKSVCTIRTFPCLACRDRGKLPSEARAGSFALVTWWLKIRTRRAIARTLRVRGRRT